MRNPYLPQPYTVLETRRETPDTVSLLIDMPGAYAPGQFVQVSLPGFGEAPISISSSSKDKLRLTVREIGNVTKALAKIAEGEVVLVRGPYGKGYPMEQLRGNNIVIIGGGCGVAPLRGIIEYIEQHRQDYKDVHLFLGYRSPDDVLFASELERWKKQYRLNVTVDTKPQDSCYSGRVGFVTEALRDEPLSSNGTVAFLCGPPKMMDNAIGILKQKGFHDDQIFVSTERLMYCALGACCHCMIRGKYTCLDGPVFRYDQIKDFTND